MPRLALPTACALLLASLPSLANDAPARLRTRAEVVHQALRESVGVQVFAAGTLTRSGSGVVVQTTTGADGKARSEIVTNAHVADQTGLKHVTYQVLREKMGRIVARLPAKLVAIGAVPDPDLAILEVNAALPAAQLADESALEMGDEVVVVGAPYGRALSVSGGMLSQIVAADTAPGQPLRFTSMKTDAPIGYGSSGGGVFVVPGGRLAGVVEGYQTAEVDINARESFDVPMPGETFLAPLTEVRSFLAAHLGARDFPEPQPVELATGAKAATVPAAILPAASSRSP